ncbi:MAG TPA: GAF domain-containing protein [Thermoleophilia bacterium]
MRVGKANGQDWLRLSEAAAALGVSLNTLRRWSDTGKLLCYRSPGGHRRYRRVDVDALLRDQSREGPSAGVDGLRRAFSAGSGDLDLLGPPLSVLAQVAAEGVGVTSCVFALIVGESRLRIVAVCGTDGGLPPAGEVVSLEDASAPAEVLRSGHRLVIADLSATSLLARGAADAYRERGQAALLALPLIIDGRHTGVMQLADSGAPRAFTGADIALAELIARQAARLIAGNAGRQDDAAAHDPVQSVGLHAASPPTEPAADLGRRPVVALHDVTERLHEDRGIAEQSRDDAHVIAELRRRNRELAQVVEAGRDATLQQSADEVLRAVVQRLTELTRAPVIDIYAVEDDTLRALVSYDGGRFDLEWEDVVIPLRRYPSSRRAVETGEMTTIASLDDLLLGEEARYSLEKWGYQAQLSMPLVSGGRVIGLAELSDYVPRDLTADLELVQGLCGVAAHALENAALLEQAERRSRILNELVELGDLDGRASGLDGLLRHAAERLRAAVDAANCDIFRVTDDGLRCVASFDRSGYDERPVGDLLDLDSYPTVVAAMNAHQVLIVTSPDDPQLSENERQTYREYGYASEVCVPLIVDKELYGLIDIYDTRERDYTEYLSFLKSAGQTLARVFENALLAERLEQRSRVLREIVELGAVALQTRDLGGALGALAERVRGAVEAADCDVYTLQGESLRCVVSADLDGFDEAVVGEVLDVDKFPATAMALRSGEAMAVPRLDDPRLSAEERENMARHGFESEFCMPLVADGRVIGLIDVFDTRPRDFGEYIDFLRSVGQMTAGAIQNALLLDELERRDAALAELVELGNVVSGAGGPPLRSKPWSSSAGTERESPRPRR